MQLEKVVFSLIQYLVTTAEVLGKIKVYFQDGKINLLKAEYFVVNLKSSQTRVILSCKMIGLTRADAGNQSSFWQKASFSLEFFSVLLHNG